MDSAGTSHHRRLGLELVLAAGVVLAGCSCRDCPLYAGADSEGEFTIGYYFDGESYVGRPRMEGTLAVSERVITLGPFEYGSTTLRGDAGQSMANLGFSLKKPWVVTEQTGRVLSFTYARSQSEHCSARPPCAREMGGDGAIIEQLLRDDTGRLVVYNALDVPTLATGPIDSTPGLVPEFAATWVDVGCGSPALDSDAWYSCAPIRCVAVRVTSRTGQSVQVLAGERAELDLDGHPFIVSVTLAVIRSDRECGKAEWSVYEKGFLERSDGGSH